MNRPALRRPNRMLTLARPLVPRSLTLARPPVPGSLTAAWPLVPGSLTAAWPLVPGLLTVAWPLVPGLLTVAWPLAWAPAWTYLAAGLGALAAVAGLRWRRGAALAVAAAIICCAFSAAGAFVLAAEGLFILAYLLAADAPSGLARPGPWLRRQAPLLVAGLIAGGAVLAMEAVHLAASAWITLAGLAAAAAAYLIALPLRNQPP